MNHSHEISQVIEVCKKLTEQKKAPTIALVKSRLDKAIPLSIIVSAIQQYKANPTITISLKNKPTEKKEKHGCVECTERFAVMQDQIDSLTSEIKAIQVAVEELTLRKN